MEIEIKLILDAWSNEYLIYVKLINSKRRNWERESNWLQHLAEMQYIWIQVMIEKNLKQPLTSFYIYNTEKKQRCWLLPIQNKVCKN